MVWFDDIIVCVFVGNFIICLSGIAVIPHRVHYRTPIYPSTLYGLITPVSPLMLSMIIPWLFYMIWWLVWLILLCNQLPQTWLFQQHQVLAWGSASQKSRHSITGFAPLRSPTAQMKVTARPHTHLKLKVFQDYWF